MCITKPIDKIIDKLIGKYDLSKPEKKMTGIFLAGIIGSAAFGYLGNLAANYVWNVILGTNSTPDQKLWGFIFNILFIALVIFYWRLVVRLIKDMK